MTQRLKFLLAALAIARWGSFQLAGTELLWTRPTGGPVIASPVVAPDGTVYVASYDRVVYALNPDGSLKWMNNLPEPTYINYSNVWTAVYGTPAVGADATLYLPCENGRLVAMNSTNGAINWEYVTTPTIVDTGTEIYTNYYPIYSSVALAADGTIYFGSYDTNLYAINSNGTLKWSCPFGAAIFASPVVGRDGTIYCGCDDGKVYAVNPDTGVANWTFTTFNNRAIAASPALGTNGTMYVGVNSGVARRLYSISSAGTSNWVFVATNRIGSSAAIGADGTIYMGCDDTNLYALNPNGTKKWHYKAGGAIKSSPAVSADGTIYFGCNDGKLYALGTNGNLIWSFYISTNRVSASPAIGPDGTVYFASENGTLCVARGCRPPVVSDWPMFGRDCGRAARAAGVLTNHAPVLAPVAVQTVVTYGTLLITNLALDTESPGQTLRYALGAGAPPGATVDPNTGVFAWTPMSTNVPATNVISVWVTDDGSPPLSDVQCFNVVILVPTPDIQSIVLAKPDVVLTWRSVETKKYRVQFKTNLNDALWEDLPGDVVATSRTATKNVPIDFAAGHRFYRVQLIP